MAGRIIYEYTFREAIRKGYIKDIRAENVAPTELVFTYQGDEHRHTLDEVLELRDEDWFSKGVALAEECNKSIVDASVLWLRDLRTTGTHHQIIAVACSIDHARQIRGLYAELGLSAKVIHSRMDTAEKDSVLRDLKAGPTGGSGHRSTLRFPVVPGRVARWRCRPRSGCRSRNG